MDGPVRGSCPGCGAPASARVDWLEIEASRERAVLYFGPQQRCEVVEVLAAHVQAVGRRVAGGELAVAEPWLLQPMR
ncbi:MAG: hypothetical protein KC431_19420, partial [Myxococcales bacterium]|nr:hypothetical protein [Myxococcales bacterium]